MPGSKTAKVSKSRKSRKKLPKSKAARRRKVSSKSRKPRKSPSKAKKPPKSRKPAKKPSKPKASKSPPGMSHSYGKGLNPFVPPGYRLVKQLGKGEAGKAFLICHNGSGCRVLKVVKLRGSGDKRLFIHEAAMQRRFHAHDLAPAVYKVGTFQKGKTEYGLIEMELVSGTFDDLLKTRQDQAMLDWVLRSIDDLIARMCQADLIHGDLHNGNIAFIDRGGARKVMLIDFGFSCCLKATKCDPRLEYIQSLRSMSLGPKINKSNVAYLESRLLATYRAKFNPRLKDDTKSWDREHNKAFEAYEKVLYKHVPK